MSNKRTDKASAKVKAAKTAKPAAKAAAKSVAAQPAAGKRPAAKPLAVKPVAAKPAAQPAAQPAAKSASVAAARVKPQPARTIAAKATPAPSKKGATKVSEPVVLPPNYRPSDDEPFMNERQRMYFRQKLLAWKEDIVRQTKETLAGLHEDSAQHADLADRATSETDRALELRARDRQRKLISKIDAALARIEDGTYGYCEETGEPIGLKRLDARPIATLSLEAQERHERRERVYRED